MSSLPSGKERSSNNTRAAESSNYGQQQSGNIWHAAIRETKMKTLLALSMMMSLVSLLATAQSKPAQANTTGSAKTSAGCSPAITGSGNTVTYKNANCGQQGKQLSEEELEEKKWLKQYPYGYAKIQMNAVTGAVVPLRVLKGKRSYSFAFQKVRVIENTHSKVTLQLPDILDENGIVRASQLTISGDPRSVESFYGLGCVGDKENGTICVEAKVLEYKGDEQIIWIVGIMDDPSPIPGVDSPKK